MPRRPPAPFASRYGPWALVAGASEGIGEAFARTLAARGLHLVLVARRAGPLDTLAAELRASAAIEVLAIATDLAAPDAPERLLAATAGLEVGLFVYNAALSVPGPLLDTPLALHDRALALNCRSPLALIHGLAPAMRARGRGGVILMSSLSGFAGTACLATYAATKAFLTTLAEGLWDELAPHGVDVVASCAGATLTPGYLATAPRDLPRLAPRPLPPAAVALDALAALGRRPRTIPGRANRLASFLLRHFVPHTTAVRVMGRAGRGVHAGALEAAGMVQRNISAPLESGGAVDVPDAPQQASPRPETRAGSDGGPSV